MFGESGIYHRNAWEVTAGCPLPCKAAAWPKDTLKQWPATVSKLQLLQYLKLIDFIILGFWGFFTSLKYICKAETPYKKELNHKKQDRFKRKILVIIITCFHINYYI